MAPQPRHIDVTFYAVVEPRWASWGRDDKGRKILSSGRVTKVTKSRPTVGPEGGVIVRLTLRMDASSFLPLEPQAVIEVGSTMADTVLVEALDPHEPEEDQ